jgi:hypothetical protein
MWLLVDWFLPLFWDELPLWSTFFLLWMTSGFCLWSLMIILALVTFVPKSYAFWLSLLFEWSMLVLWGCLSLIDETLCSLLQGELASLVEFDACCVSPWVLGEYALLHWEISWFGYCPLELEIGACHPNSLIWGGVSAFVLYIIHFAFLLHFLHTHISHLSSHVILACICLIMLITVLQWVVMRCEPFC